MTERTLIERLEAATGPDRELDRAIACELLQDLGRFKSKAAWIREAMRENWNTPAYTASIDAALTLVPEGMCIDLRRCDDGNTAFADVRESDATPDHVSDEVHVEVGPCVSPAIALCIASLKARSHD